MRRSNEILQPLIGIGLLQTVDDGGEVGPAQDAVHAGQGEADAVVRDAVLAGDMHVRCDAMRYTVSKDAGAQKYDSTTHMQ